jgi:hypothetical protein
MPFELGNVVLVPFRAPARPTADRCSYSWLFWISERGRAMSLRRNSAFYGDGGDVPVDPADTGPEAGEAKDTPSA